MSDFDRLRKPRQDENGRWLVGCDDLCGAFDDPQTPDEYKAAYIHWREHDFRNGCSHGN